MARIKEVREIPLADLVIGKGQVRVKDVGKQIDELAASIAKVGLLEPIVVCEASSPGKYEILTGQRRFLAHQKLGVDTILAGILTEKVDETTAKVISVTENLVRRDLSSKELVDACTALYQKYGNAKAVSEETGLPYSDVLKYVKYTRLMPELKRLVDDGMDVKTALRAQDASSTGGDPDPEMAVKLAHEMSGMSGVQQKKIVEDRLEQPNRDVDDLIEEAKSGAKITQVIVTLTSGVNDALSSFAKQEGFNKDEAAGALLEEALTSKGLIE